MPVVVFARHPDATPTFAAIQGGTGCWADADVGDCPQRLHPCYHWQCNALANRDNWTHRKNVILCNITLSNMTTGAVG
jgi:hypothetical protein